MGVDKFPSRFKPMQIDQKIRAKYNIQQPESTIYASANMLDDDIYKASEARQFGRFPILAYFDQKGPGHASIWRSSELQKDLMKVRNKEDENYLADIAKRDLA